MSVKLSVKYIKIKNVVTSFTKKKKRVKIQEFTIYKSSINLFFSEKNQKKNQKNKQHIEKTIE